MDTQDILEDFRDDLNLDEFQVTDAQGIKWLNRGYRKAINTIKQINEDYFYNEWTIQSYNIGQREFSLMERGTLIEGVPQDGINKVKGVSIKYKSTDEEYTKLRPTTLANLTKDLFWYETNQPQGDGFYIISDKSIFIYPAPTEVVTGGIRIYGIADPIDLTISSTSNKIPLEYQDTILPLSLYYNYYRREKMINEKNDAKIEFENELAKMKADLAQRIVTPLESEMPDLSNLG